jgi:hypothetical protein
MALQPIPTFNYLVPLDGTTHAVRQEVTLTFGIPQRVDFGAFQNDNFPFIPQGVYADNSAGSEAFSFTVEPIGFVASVPAGASEWVTFPAPADMVAVLSGSGTVNLTWVNYPVIPSSTNITAVIDSSVPVVVKRSGESITTTTASPTTSSASILAANTARTYLLLQNQDATAVVTARIGSATAGVAIPPGGSFEPLVAPIDAVAVIADVAASANSLIILEG